MNFCSECLLPLSEEDARYLDDKCSDCATAWSNRVDAWRAGAKDVTLDDKYSAGRLKSYEIYCPVCECVLVAENRAEVESGEHSGHLFVHKDVAHADSDIDALEAGIQ